MPLHQFVPLENQYLTPELPLRPRSTVSARRMTVYPDTIERADVNPTLMGTSRYWNRRRVFPFTLVSLQVFVARDCLDVHDERFLQSGTGQCMEWKLRQTPHRFERDTRQKTWCGGAKV